MTTFHRAFLNLLGLAVAALRLGLLGLVEHLAARMLLIAATTTLAYGVRVAS